MKWKSLKRGLAVLLSALLITSSVSVYADDIESVSSAQTESNVSEENVERSETQESTAGDKNDTVEEATLTKPTEEPAAEDNSETKSINVEESTEETTSTEEEQAEEIISIEKELTEETISTEEESTAESTVTEENESTEENSSEVESSEDLESTEEETTEIETELEIETAEIIAFAEIQDVVTFNTGNMEINVVPGDVYSDELFETCLDDNIYIVPFNEDGSFTIEAETDAFFPYEVQFQYDGNRESRWFMSPDDCCSVNGHMFHIHSEFSGDVITQMNLSVAGRTVTVYPEKKEFANDEGISTYSLLPLKERELTIDLRGFTPVELTMVSMSACAGSNQIKDADDIVWKLLGDSHDDYQISVSGGRVDLSRFTCSNDTVEWEIIAGKADQLAAGNIRYLVTAKVTRSREWLIPVIYCQDESGNRREVSDPFRVYDDDRGNHRWHVTPSGWEIGDSREIYVGLKVNPAVFPSTQYSRIEVYERYYENIDELTNDSQSGSYLRNNVLDVDMTQQNAGLCQPWYQKKDTDDLTIGASGRLTLVTYDSTGIVTGCLPIEMLLYNRSFELDYGLFKEDDGNHVCTYYNSNEVGKFTEIVGTLNPGNFLNSTYRLVLSYTEDLALHNEKVTAAYVGDYESIAEAQSAGAADFKDQLFGSGYKAEFSGDGVRFSIFIGEDSSENQMKQYRIYKVKESESADTVISDLRTYVRFNGLKDAAQQDIPCYSVDVMEDSYAEYNYLTMIVGKDVDLTNVAPTFVTAEGIRLYSGAEGQESEKTYHNFANGPVQYTAASSDGTRQKNYWLQIVKAEEGTKLYINSLADPESGTTSANGMITSTRELHMDNAHDQIHDILLVNMGTSPIEKISVELQSDWLELDPYWQLKGDYDLSGFTTTQKAEHGELPNMAKIRMKMKDRNIPTGTGTLIIKSNGNAIMQLNLTGTEAKAHITTEQADIEKVLAVKYVPYGLMIQNDNKYGLNQPSYTLKSGNLPKGMNLRTNGELYGVPQEAGTFTFCVHMANSSSTQSDEKEFTLTIQENTDENIEKATDEEYVILDKMPDVGSPTLYDKVFRSKGEFRYFDGDGAVYIDGRKLIRDVEYTASDGSTRIVIRAETLDKLEDGWHTLGVEFRNDNRELKRVAQNFRKGRDVVETPPPSEDKNTSSDSGGKTSSSSSSDNTAAVSQPPVPVQPLKLPPVFVDMDGNVIRGWAEAVFAGYQEALAAWLAAGGTGRMTISINAIGATDLIIPEAVVRLMAETGADYHIFLDNMVVILTSENLRLIEGEIDLNFALNRVRDFGEGFDALILDTGRKNKWFSPIFVHLVLDQEKAGQTAYLFAASESGGYELVDIQTISSNGTICFDIAQYASTIVLY